MPKFIVKRVVTETETVTARTASEAIAKACRLPREWHKEQTPFTVEQILPVPERRVVIHADDSGYDHGDYENDADREDAEQDIEQHGVWGYVCEERRIADGAWEHVDSCWGFIGGDDMLRMMREHMYDEFSKLEPIDENDAR